MKVKRNKTKIQILLYLIIKSKLFSWPETHYIKKKCNVPLSFLNIIIYFSVKKMCKNKHYNLEYI